jgi:outer membrane protein OmpA-like peptidoglycan-associated protein
LSKARSSAPLANWCVVLLGYADASEGTPEAILALAARRAESVRDLLFRYRVPASSIQTLVADSKNSLFPMGDWRNSRVELEQLPCEHQ